MANGMPFGGDGGQSGGNGNPPYTNTPQKSGPSNYNPDSLSKGGRVPVPPKPNDEGVHPAEQKPYKLNGNDKSVT